MADGDYLRDVVLPLAQATKQADGAYALERLLGTGFIVGTPQRIVTAQHVVAGLENVIAMHISNGKWMATELKKRFDHPTEDLSVFDLSREIPGKEYFKLSAGEHYSSAEYTLWGYPEDIVFDQMAKGPTGQLLANPDLIFAAGHIRRRVSYAIPHLRGRSFFELSGVAGSGASGAPIISRLNRRPDVIGVYVGERTIQIGDAPPRELGYALRLTAVADWLGQIGLGLT